MNTSEQNKGENKETAPVRLTPAPGGTYHLGAYQVARLGFGAMQLRRLQAEPKQAVSLLERAIELGVNHIDTAQFYENGFVNRIIGQVLRTGRQFITATKVGAVPDPQGKVPLKLAQRPEQLRASVEENLISLGLEHIPLVNLRRADVGPGLVAEGDQIVAIDDQLAELIAMRDEGKIGAIGLSAVNLEGLQRALPAGIACVQNAYSLVSQQDENMLQYCLANHIAWVPFFPLGGATAHGASTGWPKVTDQPKVIDLATRMNVTPSQVGLAWLLKHAPNIVLIPGTASIGHLEENITAASVVLDETAMNELNAVSQGQ